jgi:F-type H+-transporting ATPase subunit a
MDNGNFIEPKIEWSPLSYFGIDSPLANITSETIISTWIVIGLLIATVLLCRFFFNKKKSLFYYGINSFFKSFMNLCVQSLGSFKYNHFSFIVSLFLFILYSNLLGIIPFLEEPTADLNTTLALGTIGFFYTNFYALKAHGFRGYVGELFQPFFLMFPLNVIGKLASIISISFRLFGNLFGGSIISNIYMQAVGHSYILAPIALLSGMNFIVSFFFGIFEGAIQAFVFAMLTLTYLSIETQVDNEKGAS